MRKSYPELIRLEETGGLLDQLSYHNPRWRLAIYFQHIQPWRDWERDRRAMWAAEGVRWLAERIDWWLPMYVPKGMQQPMRKREARREWVAELLHLGYTQRRIMAEVGCSDDLVTAVRRTLAVDDVR